jgi:hypothetical protein
MQLVSRLLFFLNKLIQPTVESIQLLNHHFFDLKYYLNPNASEQNFAHQLNISVEKLNLISLNYYNYSFEFLINEKRYQHFLKEMQNPLNANLTIHSILNLCGFGSSSYFVDFIDNRNENLYASN